MSKYRYVQEEVNDLNTYFVRSQMYRYGKKRFKTEREAALSADKILIENKKKPVNILKPLKNGK